MRRVPLLLAVIGWSCVSTRQSHPGNRPAGVTVGEGSFTKVTIRQTPSGWVQPVTVDAVHGPEVALITDDSVSFLYPPSFEETRSVKHGAKMQWFTQLTSLKQNGELQFVDTGGGYSEVGVFDQDGRELWKWHWPGSPDLPPDKLLPADLDGDGELELYVSDRNGLARLDPSGHPVWQHRGHEGGELLVLPATGGLPPTIANGAGRFDAKGVNVGKVQVPQSTCFHQVVRWEDAVAVGSGTMSSDGSLAYVTGLDGKILFKHPISPEFGVNQVLTARFEAGQPDYVIAIGGGGGGVRNIELSIFKHDGTLVFRELRGNNTVFVLPDVTPRVDGLYFADGTSIVRYQLRADAGR